MEVAVEVAAVARAALPVLCDALPQSALPKRFSKSWRPHQRQQHPHPHPPQLVTLPPAVAMAVALEAVPARKQLPRQGRRAGQAVLWAPLVRLSHSHSHSCPQEAATTLSRAHAGRSVSPSWSPSSRASLMACSRRFIANR